MDTMQEHFVETLEAHLEEGLKAFHGSLEAPAGRRPAADLVDRSAWYNSLSGADQARVIDVARAAMQFELFGILVALDGADALSDILREYELRLVARRGEEEVLLASTDARVPDLHDLMRWA